MSRLSTLSPAAIKAMFSAESEEILITLLTIKADAAIGLPQDVRLADNFTQRLSTPEGLDPGDVYYGVISNGLEYPFVPLEITLPNDDDSAAPRCTITIQDVTRLLIPTIRELRGAPTAELRLVLNSSTDITEASFIGFKLTNISYNATTVTAELNMPSLDVEPFPTHCFTPAFFPGLF
jgi:hypothetical protein